MYFFNGKIHSDKVEKATFNLKFESNMFKWHTY